MRRLLPAVLTALLAVVAGCAGGSDAVDQSAGGEFRFVAGTGKGQLIPQQDRKAAPAISGDLLGRAGRFDLDAWRGKVVVLNFWASWCAPCRVEAPDLDAAYRRTRASGVEFVGVNTKEPDESKGKAFLARAGITYPNVWDPTGRLTLRFRDFRANGFPYTIVIDKRARVAGVYTTPLLREDIEPVVTRLAAES